MADVLLWLLHRKALVLFFILHPAWSLSVDLMLKVISHDECLQPVICKHNLSGQSWSLSVVIIPNDLFALGRSVHSVEGDIVLLSSLSNGGKSHKHTQHGDTQNLYMCSVNCSTFFSKKIQVYLQRAYILSETGRPSLFATLRPDKRQMDTITNSISALLSRDEWSTCILFTSSNGAETDITSNIKSPASKCISFIMDNDSQLNSTLDSLYIQLQKEDLNFIVVCSVTCIMDFLSQVYQFETKVGKTSNKWLVIPTAGFLGDIVNSSTQIPDADIVVIDQAPYKKEYHLLSLGDLRELLSSLDVNDISETYTGLTDYIHQTSSSVSSNMHMLNTVQKKKKIRHVGHISEDGDVVISEELFPGFRYGFKNRTLTVSTLEMSPFVIKKEENGSITYSGVCIELLQELSRGLNFSYNIVEPEDQEWGREIHGRWTGLVGEMAYKKTDLVVAPLTLLDSRESVMDFTVPYFYLKSAIILKKSDHNANKWMTLVAPFRFEVHICILFSLIFSTVFLFVVEEIHPVNTWTDNRLSARRTRYGDILWYHFGALMANGEEHRLSSSEKVRKDRSLQNFIFSWKFWKERYFQSFPELERQSVSPVLYVNETSGAYLPSSQTGRSLLSCWWLFTVISAAVYSGNLIAFLTDLREMAPFTTLAEMVEQDTYKWGTLGGAGHIDLFKNSNQSVFKKIWRGMQSDSEHTSFDTEVHIRNILERNYAYVGEETITHLWKSKQCDLQVLYDSGLTVGYAIGLPDKSAYTSIFSEQVLRIYELGLLQLWYKRWSPNIQCETAKRSAKRVDLQASQSAFYAAGVGVFLSLSVLMAEIMYKRKCKESALNTEDSEGESETRL